MRKLVAAAAIAMATVPTYAFADITSFASYTQQSDARDFVFKAATTGDGGTLSSRTTSSSKAGTATSTLFSFLASVDGGTATPIPASFVFTATTTAAATESDGFVVQRGFTGTFSFEDTSTAFTIDGQTFTPTPGNPIDLLSGSFSNATLSGTGTSGSIVDSLALTNITYTSDVVTFKNDIANDFSISLSALNQNFGEANGKLTSFGAVGAGTFSSNPAPTVNGATPELAVWGMMVLGFGLVGGTIRSRPAGSPIRLPSRQAEFA